MDKNSKIFVAGHRGMVGSALVNVLRQNGYLNLLTSTSKELDLRQQLDVAEFFKVQKPDFVIVAAAKVGGIWANTTKRAEFLYDNIMIQTNVIHQAYLHGVKKLLFLGSTCIYPKAAPQPMPEDCLLTSELEYTNEPYAIAKIAGIKMCESYNIQYGTNFISAMPTNLYGPNDNFNLEECHVLPALFRKIYLAKALENNNFNIIKEDLNKRPIFDADGNAGTDQILSALSKVGVRRRGDKKSVVEIWGSGQPKREFLWVEDLAEACLFLMNTVDAEVFKEGAKVSKSTEIRNTHVNVGTGEEISISELAELIASILEFQGEFSFNTERPDGTPRKLTDNSRIHNLGWRHHVGMEQGILQLRDWYLQN